MIDSALLDQLGSVLSPLPQTVTLRISPTHHPHQTELKELLEPIPTVAPRVQLEWIQEPLQPFPQLEIWVNQRFTGMRFRGIPSGHEFSSLILSVLYSVGLGKQPDPGITQRIQRLKGPIRLRTYVSLSCTNCPTVVQALNCMASLHADFQHEMVDGAYLPEEIERLGIQGVPTVFQLSEAASPQLLLSGRMELLELLEKLEQTFGSDSTLSLATTDLGSYQVVVVGGGPAGVSAAIYSARKGLTVGLVTDRFGGQLLDTRSIENWIGTPQIDGPDLARQLKVHMERYTITCFEHRRVARIQPQLDPQTRTRRIELQSGEALQAEQIILCTGAHWRELQVPGEKTYLGRGVGFCAHCDGPFYRGKRVAVIGGGNSGLEAALDLAGLASEVILFERAAQLKADSVLVQAFKKLNPPPILCSVQVIEILGDGKKVTGLRYQDLKDQAIHSLEVDGVFIQIGLIPNTQFLSSLLNLNSFGEIEVDPKGRTTQPGLYAAGDVTPTFKQIVTALGSGAQAALTAFEDRIHHSSTS